MRVKQVHESKYYRTLTRNLVAIILLVSLIPLITISVIILYDFNRSYKAKSSDHLESLLLRHKLQIDAFLYEKLADIKVIASSASYEELSSEDFLKEELELLQTGYHGVFVDLGFVDENGNQLAYAGPFKLGKAVYSDAEWFKKAMASESFISDVFLGMRGLPHFIVAVQKKHDGKTYILRSTIDFVAFNSLVENIQIGKTGLAFIVNKKGELQTNIRFESTIPNDFIEELIRKNLSPGKDNVIRIYESGKNKIIYVINFLKNGDWILVYQQNRNDFYSGYFHTRNVAILLTIIAIICVATTAVIVSKNIVNRIERVDREKDMMNEQIIETGKLASLGELAAGIAHEINNPVAIMVEEAGWIGDLLEEEDFKQSENLDEFNRSLRQIQTQGYRCKDITHKLLSFARKTDSSAKEVQLNELVTEVVSLSEQRARYANIKFKMNLAPELPTVNVSPSEVQQVILNLINNAIDAMDSKGGEIEFASRFENGQAIIDVGDNGQGIPKANLQRIFDPFFTTKAVGKGTGQGLAIAYSVIVDKHGGHLDVESEVGKGTCFSIRLPLNGS